MPVPGYDVMVFSAEVAVDGLAEMAAAAAVAV